MEKSSEQSTFDNTMSYLGPEANFRLLFNELLENKVHYDSNGFTIE